MRLGINLVKYDVRLPNEFDYLSRNSIGVNIYSRRVLLDYLSSC